MSLPEGLQIEPTNKCNLACVMCVRNTWRGEKFGQMDFGLYQKIIDETQGNLKRLALYGFGDTCKLARKNGYIVFGTWTPSSYIGSKNSELYAKQIEDIRKNLPERFSCVDVRSTHEYILVTCKCIPP